MALELAYVMPDRKTAYMSDDGTNVGLFRFVADRAGDLGAGTLYAAVWTQTDYDGLGAADLTWVNLGHATDTQVAAWIDNYTFDDIFDVGDPDSCDTASGYVEFNAGHEDGKHQCLKLKDGVPEVVASRLESRRWAAMQGATTEFRKMEGITFNPEGRTLYIAMSEINKGMGNDATSKYDTGGPNRIQLNKNSCGGVYALDVDDDYTATKMAGLVAGIPMTVGYGADVESPDFDGRNECDLDHIANPDNLTYMSGYGTLIIGEDSSDGHQNDAIWAYDLASASLTRIETTPYGSETTSPYFYPDINGYGYLMSVVQHPYGESDQTKLEGVIGRARAYTGYIGPFPAMDENDDRGRKHR